MKIILFFICYALALKHEDMIIKKDEEEEDPLPGIGSILDTLFSQTHFQENTITLLSVFLGGFILILFCCCCLLLSSPALSFCLFWSRLQNVLGARFERVKTEFSKNSAKEHQNNAADTIIEMDSRVESRF